VIRRSTELARRFLKNPRAVDPSMAEDVLVVAAVNGDADLFQQLDALRRDPSTTPEQRANVGRALGRFSDAGIVQKWLETIVKDTRNQDAAGFIASVLTRVPVQKTAWEWVKQHWSEIEPKLTSGSGSAIVGATRTFCEAPLREDARQFFTAHPVQASERTFAQAQEISNGCIKVRGKLQADVAGWLQQHGADGKAGNR
jgi:hypothetical protein